MRLIAKGATSQTVYFSVNDSASTTGGKKTGILFNAAGLVASYTRNGAARTAITLATQTTSGAWSSGGWVEVDATNEPGLYRFDVPDAAFASGVDSVVIQVRGATGMVDAVEEVQLTAVNLQDAVRAGLTALPNANAGANGGLPTGNASGRVDVGNWLGTAPNALISGRLDTAVALRSGTAQAGAVGSITLDAGASATDSLYSDMVVWIAAGTGVGQGRLITGYTGSTKVASVTPNWATAPDNTSVFVVMPHSRADLALWQGSNANILIAGRVDANAQVVGDKTGYTAATVSDKTGYSLANGSIAAATFAAGAVDATAFAQGAADKVWSSATRTLTAFSTALAVSIWDVLASAIGTASSIGVQVKTNLDAVVSSRLATSGYTAPPSAASISTQVWTEPIPGAFAAGSAGAKLNSASAAGDPWATLLPAAYGAGTAGNKLGNLSGASGSGANTVVVTVQNDVAHPVAGAQFWVTTDSGGINIIASGTTDTFGKVTVFLNNGTFYGWAAKPGENFTLPITMVVP